MQLTLFTLTILSLVYTTLAKITITVPNSKNWWIDSDSQTFAWTTSSESDPEQFITIIKNDDEDVLPSKQAAVTGIIESDRGSYQIDSNAGVNLSPGKGYVLVFADPTDQNKEFAKSEEFEIKPEGSAYPDASATVPASASPSASSNNASTDDDDSNASAATISALTAALAMSAALSIL
ncbi:hypothetical protein E3P77_04054 [Wallemia ichthyophaga]|nr:hypothetical protein E3P91_04086 [Wallemia ichthyophaga]TIA87092.1 hypothetical protein E3P97_04074 [Wallemia ichthyophaga]TIA97323.1 hypothetical protein E3P96_03426 [Wallemia ichthyophaga]TIB27801.1 hypothetical protein E3P85_04055 [Wallemia ichthyophaga]TIB43164.1 hypothetical protein E3P82_04073 [Wallemia ichthyophaga]